MSDNSPLSPLNLGSCTISDILPSLNASVIAWASYPHEQAFGALRHLSRYRPPLIPLLLGGGRGRFPDRPTGLLKGGSKFRPQPLDLTDNFFPPESLGTTYSENTYLPLYVWNFTDGTTPSNPILQVIKVRLCTKLQRFIARCLYICIIQSLSPMLDKDLMKVCSLSSHRLPSDRRGTSCSRS